MKTYYHIICMRVVGLRPDKANYNWTWYRAQSILRAWLHDKVAAEIWGERGVEHELKLNARRAKRHNNSSELSDDNLWIHPLRAPGQTCSCLFTRHEMERASCSNTNFLCTLTWNSSNARTSHFVSGNKSGPVASYLRSQGYFSKARQTTVSGFPLKRLTPLKRPFTSKQWCIIFVQTRKIESNPAKKITKSSGTVHLVSSGFRPAAF